VDVAGAVIEAHPAALQLRAKDLAPRETLQLLRALHPICRSAGVPLFANDRVDLAALAGCEGVHVGQEDMPIATIRRMAPALRVGLSTHTPEQAQRALADRRLIAFGPTETHRVDDPVVGEALRAVAAAPRPVVASVASTSSGRPKSAAPASGTVIAGCPRPRATVTSPPSPSARPPRCASEQLKVAPPGPNRDVSCETEDYNPAFAISPRGRLKQCVRFRAAKKRPRRARHIPDVAHQ
jgi:thiamine-phosphate pyrophosphorylase